MSPDRQPESDKQQPGEDRQKTNEATKRAAEKFFEELSPYAPPQGGVKQETRSFTEKDVQETQQKVGDDLDKGRPDLARRELETLAENTNRQTLNEKNIEGAASALELIEKNYKDNLPQDERIRLSMKMAQLAIKVADYYEQHGEPERAQQIRKGTTKLMEDNDETGYGAYAALKRQSEQRS